MKHTVASIIDVDSLLEWCEHEDEYIARLKKSLYSQNKQLVEFEKENHRLRRENKEERRRGIDFLNEVSDYDITLLRYPIDGPNK